MLLGKIGFNDMVTIPYNRHKNDKIVGLYGFLGSKTLLVNDLDLIKDILIKDFDHFVDRRYMEFSKNPYIQNMLTLLTGEKWRAMRSMMSPIFTSGKLRGMVPLIDNVGDRFVKHLESGKDFEAKEMLTHFTVEVIGSCGFGIEVNSFNNPDGVFNDNVRI